jgi:hypothetical protein
MDIRPATRHDVEVLIEQLKDAPAAHDPTEKDADGVVVRSHADTCDYLFKRF